MQRGIGDPLRSSMPDGQFMGTRFGAKGDSMGQVLCDARWLEWTYVDSKTLRKSRKPTWSNVQYEFYDSWFGNKQKPYLPGSFAYKSMGEVVPPRQDKRVKGNFTINTNGKGSNTADGNNDTKETTYPLALTDYMLSAWGGFRTKGMDILGEEPLVLFRSRLDRPVAGTGIFRTSPDGLDPYRPVGPGDSPVDAASYALHGIPAWTRGVNRSHIGPLWGSPYGPADSEGLMLSHGNPNGYKDGLILMLTGGSQGDF
jgi:hypothetical protein